jgi:hypothetical protein
LVAGGDPTESVGLEVQLHLQQCRDCRELGERLSRSQALLRSLRQEPVPNGAVAEMHKGLLARLDNGEAFLGWWLRFERFLVLQLRRPRYAVAGVALAVVISATLFAQLRRVAANLDTTAAVFDAQNALSLPEDYREWVFVGTSTTYSHTGGPQASQNVYLSPSAYQEYRRSGHFPEGAVLVLESTEASGQAVALFASVKDPRFDDGWGYFRFGDNQGQYREKAPALPVAEGCVTCHHNHATDHVFTQFYPVLRGASGVL